MQQDEYRRVVINGLGAIVQAYPNDPGAAQSVARAIRLLRDQADAEEAKQAVQHAQQEQRHNNSLQDMLTKETLHVLRGEREHALASEETRDDFAYINLMNHIPEFRHIGHLIALVARFAGELPHDLINPYMRQRLTSHIDLNLNMKEQVGRAESILGRGTAWEQLVDPGLAGNARIACDDISQALPQLFGINIEHVFDVAQTACGDASNEHAKMFIDYFCAVTAARWRANSVLAAQPYKTKNEQDAVMVALRESSKRLRHFAFDGYAIQYRRAEPPRTLSELRGSNKALSAAYLHGVRPL